MKIASQTWVVVADGEKALFLVNSGNAVEPALSLIDKETIENPPTREQGTDRPGRYPSGGEALSGVEQTDWHEYEKTQFAKAMADRLNAAAASGAFEALVLIAPASTLGEMRNDLEDAASAKLKAEIEKDLTNHPVPRILSAIMDFEG